MKALLLIYSVSVYIVIGVVMLLLIQPAFNIPHFRNEAHSQPCLVMKFKDGGFDVFEFKTIYVNKTVLVLDE